MERFVEQERQYEAEGELQEDRGARPPERVAQRSEEGLVLGERTEVIEADETAGEGLSSWISRKA